VIGSIALAATAAAVAAPTASVAPATAASVTTAAAPGPTAAAASVTTATAAILAGLGFVDGEPSAVVFLVVEAVDGGLGLGLGVHLDEPEPLAPAGVAVLDDLGALDGPELREELLELRAVDLIGQITDIQLLAHRWSPGRRKFDPLETFRVEEKGAKDAQSVGRRKGARAWVVE
jgi:hypothetical protein